MTNLALPYLRQSKGRDDETDDTALSLETQLVAIRQWAERNGYDLLPEIRDRDETGRKMNRPGLNELREKAKRMPGLTVAVYKRDRFARSLVGAEVVIAELESHGVDVVSVTEPGGKLSRHILGAIAEYQSDQLSERLADVKAVQANKGIFPFPRMAYGWRRNGKEITVHDEEAAIVREVFSRILAGDSHLAIAADLQRRGVPTQKGGDWTATVLRLMTRNPIYGGYVRHKGKVVSEATNVPPIIDRATWEQAQAIIGKRPPMRDYSYDSWLAGLVSHACGARMYLVGWKDRGGVAHPTFMCRSNTDVTRCAVAHRTVRRHKLETMVKQALAYDLSGVVSVEDALREAEKAAGGRNTEKARTALAKRREAAEKRRARARELWLAQDDPLSVWQEEQAKYDAAIAEIEAEEAALPAMPDPLRFQRAAEVLTSVADIITDDRTDEGLRPILEAVGTVIVGEKGVSITYEREAAWLVPEPRVIPWG